MKQATGYLRVSTTKQDATSQRAVIERYASANGLSVVAWIEETESGAKDWQGRRLSEAVKAGAVVIVSEVSRVARSLLGVLEFGRDITAAGGELHIANISTKLDGSIGSKAMVSMMAMVAELERGILIERTRAGLENAKTKADEEGRTLRGRGKAKSYKLDGRAKEIDNLIGIGVTKSNIAKICKVTRGTLDEWIKRRTEARNDCAQH